MRFLVRIVPCLWTMLVAAVLDAQVILGPTGPANPAQRPPLGRTPDEPIVYRLEVTPAPEPIPPLKYSLYPRWSEMKTGNSVPMWYRAIAEVRTNSPPMKALAENYDRWFTEELSDMPVDEVRSFVESHHRSLYQAREAAYREATDWDLQLRNLRGTDTIMFLLSEFQESRELARLLSLSTRLHLREGDFDAALADMTIAFRLAHDVAEPETFINDLVGIAICAITEDNVRHLIGMPGSPNLYWALALLPRPAIDIRDSTQMEMTLPERYFPWLKDPLAEQRTPEQWRQLLQETLREVSDLRDARTLPRSSASETVVSVALAGLCLRGYPTAVRDLIDVGYIPDDITAMPVGQVIALHQRLVYEVLSQSFAATVFLPYPAAQGRFAQLKQDLHNRGYLRANPWEGRETIPIAGSLLSGFEQVQTVQIRRDVMRAALMTIEAIRMHLAVSDGKLPASLDDITVVPVPKNPWTEAPFDYQFREGVAVIDLPLPSFHRRFEIRVAETARE